MVICPLGLYFIISNRNPENNGLKSRKYFSLMRRPAVGNPNLIRWLHNAIRNPGSFSSSPHPLTSLAYNVYSYVYCMVTRWLAAPPPGSCPSKEKKKRQKKSKEESVAPITGMQKSSRNPRRLPFMSHCSELCLMTLPRYKGDC